MQPLDHAFAALADPTRRGIVVHLARREATVNELVDKFHLTQPTISSHLKVLEIAGLISRRRIAQSRPCKLVPARLKAVTDWLEQVQAIWEGNYKRLDALLAELKRAQRPQNAPKPRNAQKTQRGQSTQRAQRSLNALKAPNKERKR